MIQRIQTVFLVFAAILIAFTVFFPIAEMVGKADGIVYELGFKGFLIQKTGENAAFSTLPLSILISLCLLITVVTIFLYKRRMLQIRLSTFNIILLVGLQGLMFYYIKMSLLRKDNRSGAYGLSLSFTKPPKKHRLTYCIIS